MLKNIFFFITILSTINLNSKNMYGATDLVNFIEDELNVHGASCINNTDIKNIFTASGETKIYNSTFKFFQCHGACHLEESVIKDMAKLSGAATIIKSEFYKNFIISGALSAKASKFKNVFIYSSESSLKNSYTKKVEVHYSENNKTPTLKLVNCLIDGDIIFTGNSRTLIINSSKTINGSVINDHIEKI